MEKVAILSTTESCWGDKRLAQIVPLPIGRIDKVSLYLEPTVSDGSQAYVVCDIFAMDGFGFPTGGVAASDAVLASSIKIPGYVNFSVPTSIGTAAVVSLRVQDGGPTDFVSWRYARASAGGEELMVSSNAGATWSQDPTKKFAYIAYSNKQDAVDSDEQSATIQAGTVVPIIDDDAADWTASAVTGERTAVNGDTVIIDFTNISVTLIVDQSGSMTWNDNAGIRFDFLKEFIDGLDSSIATYSPSSSVTYSIVKFGGRKVGKIDISVDGSDLQGFDFEGVRIVRKIGSPPSGPTDGIVAYEGTVQHFTDNGLSADTLYYYGIFSVNKDSIFSVGRLDRAIPGSDTTAPTGVAQFLAVAEVVLSGTDDLGGRRASISWSNPAGFDYANVFLVRRTDRFPESILDGDLVLSDVATTTSYLDVGLLTDTSYYYAIFTEKTDGIKCATSNARTALAVSQALDRSWEKTESGTPPVGLDVTRPGRPTPTVLVGDSTSQIDWIAADADSKKFNLWSRTDGYPNQIDDLGREFDGTLLYSDVGTEFIHRALNNGQEYFYLLVSVDAVGNVSDPVTFSAIPLSSSIISIPPDQVSGFEGVVLDSETVSMSWNNPTQENFDIELYFDQQARVVSSVEFADDGTLGTSVSFELSLVSSNIVEFVDPVSIGLTPIDPTSAIILSNSPTLGAGTISALVTMTPYSTLLNRIKEADIFLQSTLSVKDGSTGATLASIASQTIHIAFKNPFSLSISNDPIQLVSRRQWQELEGGGDKCNEFDYNATSLPGVYAGTNEAFHAVIEAEFDGLALSDPATVTLALLDPVTRNVSSLVTLSDGVSVFNIPVQTDEILDRNGVPTGNTTSRSVLRLDLPPSDIPGDFILQATSTYRGYVQTAEMDIHYEPTLNVDLILRPFNVDGVDVAEQKAFVYFGAFDAPQSEKRPVPDFTITNWSIRSLCADPRPRPLYGGDVPGLGVRAYTHGGLAQGILWGPSLDADTEEAYEVHVTVQVGGVKSEGFGMLVLGLNKPVSIYRILLRSPSGFTVDQVEADGESESVWEVLARPEEELDTGIESGGFFINAVVGAGGSVPSLPDGSVVSLTVTPMQFADSSGGPSTNTLKALDIMKNLIIKTNLTGTNGISGTANASVETIGGFGKAIFRISINGSVPPPDDNDVTQNDFTINNIYGIQFDRPNNGIVLVLTANTVVESNGNPINFKGGGSDLINDAPPTFLGLVEPLSPS